MRFELCRHCGEETQEAEKCDVCHQFYKYLCPECNVIYEDFHSNCSEYTAMTKIVIE